MDTVNLIEYTVGFYMLTIGVSLLINRKVWSSMIKDLKKSRVLIHVSGLVSLIIGLFCIFAVSSLHVDIVLHIIIWLMVIKGVVGLLVPVKITQKLLSKKFISGKKHIQISGIISILIGLYLILL